MLTTKTRRPTIQANYGSRRKVARVFCYDAVAGRASVRFADGDTDTLSLSELEALEPDGNTYADLDAALRDAANEVVE